jgi:polyphosphate kinase 2
MITYEEFLLETKTSKFINSIKKLFLSKEDKKQELKLTLVDILNKYKDDLIKTNKKMEYKKLKEKIKELKETIGEDIVKDLNLDTFIKGIYNVSLLDKNRRDKLEKYFNDYINILDERINFSLDTRKNEEEDDEISDLFKNIEILKKLEHPKVPKSIYNNEKNLLQIELLKMQEWIIKNNKKVAIICEGRDAAGKGSTIKILTEHLNPKYYNIATFGIPSEEEKKNWFKRYLDKMPKPGNITFFDRSYYNRAVNDPVMGFCAEEEYKQFINDVNPIEKELVENGIILIKIWFSIEKDTQELRFKMRQANPLSYWKYSPNDENSKSKWEIFTIYKEQMFRETSTKIAPWVVIDSNDKRLAQLNTMKYILNYIPYDNKKNELLEVYPEVVHVML